MSRSVQVTCNICGAIKRDTNHWFVAREEPRLGSLILMPAGSEEDLKGSYILADLCGEECVTRVVQQWLRRSLYEEGLLIEPVDRFPHPHNLNAPPVTSSPVTSSPVTSSPSHE